MTFPYYPLLSFRRLSLVLVALVGFAATSCKDKKDDPQPPQNIVQVAQSNPVFSILVAAITKADLAGTLSGGDLFTVLAPTNAAFTQLPAPYNTADNIAAITDAGQIATLRGILLYHVLPGRKPATDFPAGASTQTTAKPASTGINDNTVYVSKNGSTITLNGVARIASDDLAASNGIIHAIDKVLLPPTRRISELVVAAASGPAPEFTLLLAALQRPAAAELLAAVNNPAANLTVFAPTDAAFRALLPQLMATNLSDVPDATLLPILRLHVVSSRAFSPDLRTGALPTLGGTVTVGMSSTGLTVSGSGNTTGSATVVNPNLLAVNGVVHVIDRVLRP
ncbi:fasciclin domain-containing protein [Hymenobacter sp. BT664]|uniref:Fasciclin domain-containing protein n=1 Tax=Hymenobacter montanus TaxID=2771359 RepID=A0A927GJU1_9BACT|nr:fasciclin domain-containing protein [Hymenobacter montanus]MBD2768848.1 fasciclin domain-containing protein [Hymenobacter montanus]